MESLKLHRAIAAAAAAAITIFIFSGVNSIAAEDRARLAYAHSVHLLIAANAPDTIRR